MVFAFGFLLAGLIALAASTTPEQASRNLKAWKERLTGSKSGTPFQPTIVPGGAKDEHNSGGDESLR
jgi:hypothetical protein